MRTCHGERGGLVLPEKVDSSRAMRSKAASRRTCSCANVEDKIGCFDRPDHRSKWKANLTLPFCSIYSVMESLLYMDPNILNRVKDLRLARGWTQEELAKATGVSRQSINSIERNRYVPSLALALTFARVFACSTDEIFLLERKA
jgi:putative transcriptional regulator